MRRAVPVVTPLAVMFKPEPAEVLADVMLRTLPAPVVDTPVKLATFPVKPVV